MQNLLLIGGIIFLTVTHVCYNGLAKTPCICVECPLGTISDSENINCSCCKQPGFCANESYCRPCPPGQYNNKSGQSQCSFCPEGSFSNSLGTVNCSLCDPGFYQTNKGKEACIGCETGTNCSTHGCVRCSACKAGTRSNTFVNATSCKECPMGTFSSAKEGMCTFCQIGTFGNASGMSACLPCAPGSVARIGGATNCSICPPGSYAFRELQACSTCHSGSYCTHPGCAACTLCPPGSVLPNLGSTKPCHACGPGTYAHSSGSAFCKYCPKGTYSIKHNVSTCPLCDEGYFCPNPVTRKKCPKKESFCPRGSVEPIQCHGPVFTINMESKYCVVSPEFLGVLIASIAAALFIACVCVVLVWRRLAKANPPRSISPTENTHLVTPQQTMYTGV